MKTLLENRYLRITALLLALQIIIEHPLELSLVALVVAVVYLSDQQDIELVQDIKTSLAKVDLSSVKQLFNKSEDPVSEPVVKPAPESTYKEVVEEALEVEPEVKPAPEPKVEDKNYDVEKAKDIGIPITAIGTVIYLAWEFFGDDIMKWFM